MLDLDRGPLSITEVSSLNDETGDTLDPVVFWRRHHAGVTLGGSGVVLQAELVALYIALTWLGRGSWALIQLACPLLPFHTVPRIFCDSSSDIGYGPQQPVAADD